VVYTKDISFYYRGLTRYVDLKKNRDTTTILKNLNDVYITVNVIEFKVIVLKQTINE